MNYLRTKGYEKTLLAQINYIFFEKARQVAMVSDYHKTHVGCVTVYHGKIIAIGCNRNKTHPIQNYYNKYREKSCFLLPKLHAEINCINKIKNLDIDFSKVKLFIYRIRKDRPFGISGTCPSCMAVIKDLGIKDIYYTTNDGYVHERIEKYDVGGVA